MAADPYNLAERYPMAAALVARLNTSGQRRYERLLNREYASDIEAVTAIVTRSAGYVSGEHGEILGALIATFLERLEALEGREPAGLRPLPRPLGELGQGQEPAPGGIEVVEAEAAEPRYKVRSAGAPMRDDGRNWTVIDLQTGQPLDAIRNGERLTRGEAEEMRRAHEKDEA